jgi:hypothetical protein
MHLFQFKIWHAALLTASTEGTDIRELKLFLMEELGKYFEKLLNVNIFSCVSQNFMVKYLWTFLLISFVVFRFHLSFFA